MNFNDMYFLIFQTRSGSVYEVDRERMIIRRIEGPERPGRRTGIDSTWRPYARIEVEVGRGAVVTWPSDVVDQEAHVCTVTSKVVGVVK